MEPVNHIVSDYLELQKAVDVLLKVRLPRVQHDLFVSITVGNKKNHPGKDGFRQCSIVKFKNFWLNEIVNCIENCDVLFANVGANVGKYLIFPYIMPDQYHIPFYQKCKGFTSLPCKLQE